MWIDPRKGLKYFNNGKWNIITGGEGEGGRGSNVKGAGMPFVTLTENDLITNKFFSIRPNVYYYIDLPWENDNYRFILEPSENPNMLAEYNIEMEVNAMAFSSAQNLFMSRMVYDYIPWGTDGQEVQIQDLSDYLTYNYPQIDADNPQTIAEDGAVVQFNIVRNTVLYVETSEYKELECKGIQVAHNEVTIEDYSIPISMSLDMVFSASDQSGNAVPANWTSSNPEFQISNYGISITLSCTADHNVSTVLTCSFNGFTRNVVVQFVPEQQQPGGR